MEKIFFANDLVQPILEKEKTSTWRINEDVPFRRSNTVGLKEDEIVALCDDSGVEFARARIVEIKDTVFGELSKEEKTDHGQFLSDLEMYQTFTRYYQTEISARSKLRIIKFEIVA